MGAADDKQNKTKCRSHQQQSFVRTSALGEVGDCHALVDPFCSSRPRPYRLGLRPSAPSPDGPHEARQVVVQRRPDRRVLDENYAVLAFLGGRILDALVSGAVLGLLDGPLPTDAAGPAADDSIDASADDALEHPSADTGSDLVYAARHTATEPDDSGARRP